MTYFMPDNYAVYDSLPCSAAIFSLDDKPKVVYSNAVYDKTFGESIVPCEKDRAAFISLASAADGPTSIYFSTQNAQGEKINVRAFVVKISDDKAFSLLIDDCECANRLQSLNTECTRYAAAIRGTDETFFEYDKKRDLLTVFFSADGKIDTDEIMHFMSDIDGSGMVYDENKDIIRALTDNVHDENRFEARLKLRSAADYEWYSLIVRRDETREDMFIGSARNIDEIKAEEEKLKEKVLIDPLSKVYNRSAAIERIEKLLSCRTADCECALLVLDIDNFKRINDTFGHLYGDAVIAMAAGSIKNTLDEDDVIGRFGGDEFFVFIDNAEKGALEQKLENIRQSILKMRLDQSDQNDISCSIGVAIGNGTFEYEELFRRADGALYSAKKNGKNRFEYFDGTYADETNIHCLAGNDENESNAEHNLIAIALEIASKATTAEAAVSNILRHVGMALELYGIQTLRYDTIEDKVYLEYQWWKELGGTYNVTITEKKMGYYDHNDLILFKNRFAKDKLFAYTPEFKEEFSQKYRDVMEKTEHWSTIYACNTQNESVFHVVMYQSDIPNRAWTQKELSDMEEITKLLSMYLKSASITSEREKMLINRLDYDWTGLYTISAFYEEAGRITRLAKAADESVALIHIDIDNMYLINNIHGRDVGDMALEALIDRLEQIEKERGLACHINGTDKFIILVRTAHDAQYVADEIEKLLSELASSFSSYTSPKIIYKGGVCLFKPGEYIVNAIDAAGYVKKHHKWEQSACLIAEAVGSQYKRKGQYQARDRRK